MVERAAPEWTIVDFIHQGYWWKNRGILLLNLCLLLPLLTSVTNGFDASLINGLQIIPDWQTYFKNPSGKSLGLINAAQGIGCLIASPLAPFLSDSLGRRAGVFIGSIVMLAGVSLQAAALNISMLIAARMIVGLGLTLCLNASPLLLIELSYPTQRGKITSLYNTSWYLGSIISAWACFGTFKQEGGSVWSWRVPTLLQAFIPILQVCLVWFIPESPRYLVAKGMEGQAARVLAKYHANKGDERDPLVVFEVAQIRHALRMEEENNKTTSYLSLIATPGNRRRMLIILGISLFSQWSGNGLVSYYINLVLDGVGITNTDTKAYINGGLQVFNLGVAVSASMLVDWVGRRTLFIISNTGMLITFACWTVTTALYNTHQNAAAAKATIPLIFIFYFFYDIAYTPMLIAYTLEILPYRIRAKGFSVAFLTIQLTVAFNQFVNPWAIQAIGWWYYVVYCGWLVAELVFILIFIVETKGRTLEETAALFDGEDQHKELVYMAGDAATMTAATIMETGLTTPQINKPKDTEEFHELRQRNRSLDLEQLSPLGYNF